MQRCAQGVPFGADQKRSKARLRPCLAPETRPRYRDTVTFQAVSSRHVKTVYFSEPVTGLPKPVFLPVTERLIVSGIIVTGRSALAISRLLVASRRPWPTFQTHGRRETKDSGVSKR